MRHFTLSTAAAVLAATAAPVAAFWRLPCQGTAGVARLDPLVDPHKISDHAHVVHGGGSEFRSFLVLFPVNHLGLDCVMCVRFCEE